MSTETRWWWIRHAPVIDHGGRIYGQRDMACDTSDGVAMGWLAAALPEDAVWVTSHLRRAIDTAAAVAAAGLEAPEPLIEPDLAEQNFGDWQGLAWDELRAAGNPEYDAFWDDPGNTPPPGGESLAQVIARVSAVIERLTAEHAGRDIVAVTHGGTIRSALALAFDLEPVRAIGFLIDNLSLTRIDHFSDGILAGRGTAWRVVTVNALRR